MLAGTAGMLAGCSPTTTSSKKGVESGGSAVAATGVEGRNPNVQIVESEFGKAERGYDTLFSPLQIGSQTLRNRIVKSGAGSPHDTPEQSYVFYESLAKGGTALVMVDSELMDGDGAEELCTEIAKRVHDNGALIGLQHYAMTNWMPGGLCSSSKAVIVTDEEMQVGPTGMVMPIDYNSSAPKMATTDEVKEVVQEFVQKAQQAKACGFDAFELNAGCNHFLDSFLSRVYNCERTDEYGPQSLENRARIVTDIIQGVHQACGDDFIVSVLYNALEFNAFHIGDNEECLNVAEAIEFAKIFEAAGADVLHVRWAVHGNHAASFFPDRLFISEAGNTGYGNIINFTSGAMDDFQYRYNGAAAFMDVAAKIKQSVSIPVGTVGCMDPRLAPDEIEGALEDGKLDFVLMTRPLIADPELPQKLQDGLRDEVAPCTHCETCFMDSDCGGCRVNPVFGRGGSATIPEGYEYSAPSGEKKVAVIGGGPAGMEAARTAALCGHKVTLYEKKGSLGGKMEFASMAKGSKELIGDYINYLTHQMDVRGVAVKLETEATADTVKDADVVIVATGADYADPDIPGFADSSLKVAFSDGLMCENKKIVLIGNGLQTVNMAEALIRKDNQVTIVSAAPVDAIAEHMPSNIRKPTLNWLRAKGCKFFNGCDDIEVTDSGVEFTTSWGMGMTIDADGVMSANETPNIGIADQLGGPSDSVILVGDALLPSNIVRATASGHLAARYLKAITAEEVAFTGNMPDMAAGGSAEGAMPAGDGAAMPTGGAVSAGASVQS